MLALQRARTPLYVVLFIVSTVLLGLTAKRIHDTETFAFFHDPVAVELLVASIIGMLWSPYGVVLTSRTIVSRGAIFIECLALFILFMKFLVGAASSGELKCLNRRLETCGIMQALQSFGWICWFFTFLTLVLNTAQIIYEERYRGHSVASYQRMAEVPGTI